MVFSKLKILWKVLNTTAVLSPRNRAKPCKFRYVKPVGNFIRKIIAIDRDKKAVISQRWPRNAPYTWVRVPWKFSKLPDYDHGYYSQQFSRAFVRIDPLNVPTKFEVRSFIRSSDNRGYPKKLDSPWIRPRSLFSKIFNRLLFRLTL